MSKDEILNTIIASIEDGEHFTLIDSKEAREAYNTFCENYIDNLVDREKACEMGSALIDILGTYVKAAFTTGFDICKELMR